MSKWLRRAVGSMGVATAVLLLGAGTAPASVVVVPIGAGTVGR